MKPIPLLLLLALWPLQVFAQSGNPVVRKDSATVSAGISKEQLALEDQLNQILSDGDGFLRSGNATEAITQYRKALELVQKQSLLNKQEARVDKKLAIGYMSADQPTDAIPIYEKLLASRKQDCATTSEKPSECADAQFELGRAKMYAGDFSGALVLLRDAESNYVRAEKIERMSHEYEMIQIKNEGQTNILLAVAFLRTGSAAEATKTLELAISQLGRVQSDQGIEKGIREDASRSLEEAQTILSKLKSSQ